MKGLFFALICVSMVLSQISNEEPCLVFPNHNDFKFGVATSAYQIEGAYLQDGKSLNIWDDFCAVPGNIADGTNGNVANDHYNNLEKDTKIIKELNVGYYRFSISWARILPNASGIVNELGVQHYRKEIELLKSNGIEPVVTLYHWDLPSYLHVDSQPGWLNSTIADAFEKYANVCFSRFGDIVKYWITFNEPWVFAWQGYGIGTHAPGRCSNGMGKNCTKGDSSTEPYIVAHHCLRAHAKAVDRFRKDYQKLHNGSKIGITLNTDWALPLNESDPRDAIAAFRFIEFSLGWFADPVTKGDYPDVMKEKVGNRLLSFTPEEKILLKGSLDFLGINHYTTTYVSNTSAGGVGWQFDKATNETKYRHNKPIGDRAQSPWLYVYPDGMYKILTYVNYTYAGYPIWITENGVDAPNESNKTLNEVVQDTFRVNYLKGYIGSVLEARKNGVDVQAYFVWSLMDNFEWAEGYVSRFGIYYNNYTTQTRTPKLSVSYYKDRVVKCNKNTDNFLMVLIIIVGGVILIAAVIVVVYCIVTRRSSATGYENV